MSDVTVCIPTIPPRREMLTRAVASVMAQTQPAAAFAIALDSNHAGAARTRQRALDMVTTEWVAFLDDDDYFYPNHLETLLRLGEEADFVYSWFDGNNPFPMHRGRQMDVHNPHHTTMTVMVRTSLAQSVGFHTDHPEGWILPQEDWRFVLDCINAGARFAGTGEITWHYNVHGNNTSGLGARW